MTMITCLLALFLGCTSETTTPSTSPPVAPPTQAAVPFKIAFNTWLGYSPLVIAKEKGFLAESNIDADISIIEGIGEKNSALIRGDIDGVGHTADSAVTSAASGVKGQVVFVFDQSFGADGVLARNTIRTVADLKGKRVALEPGFTGHFFLLFLLDEVGLGPTDITVVPMDTGSAGGAFVAGAVDAAVTWEPWIGKSKELKDAHVLVTSRDRPGLIIDVLYMNSSTIQKRPDDVKKLVAAMGKATDWYFANTAEGDEIISRFWKMSAQEEKDTVSGMKFMTLSENATFFGTESAPGPLHETIGQAITLWQKAGVITVPVDASRIIDYNSVNQAAAKSP